MVAASSTSTRRCLARLYPGSWPTGVAAPVLAHANTGDNLKDHTEHVIWLGSSETLNLAAFSKRSGRAPDDEVPAREAELWRPSGARETARDTDPRHHARMRPRVLRHRQIDRFAPRSRFVDTSPVLQIGRYSRLLIMAPKSKAARCSRRSTWRKRTASRRKPSPSPVPTPVVGLSLVPNERGVDRGVLFSMSQFS